MGKPFQDKCTSLVHSYLEHYQKRASNFHSCITAHIPIFQECSKRAVTLMDKKKPHLLQLPLMHLLFFFFFENLACIRVGTQGCTPLLFVFLFLPPFFHQNRPYLVIFLFSYPPSTTLNTQKKARFSSHSRSISVASALLHLLIIFLKKLLEIV